MDKIFSAVFPGFTSALCEIVLHISHCFNFKTANDGNKPGRNLAAALVHLQTLQDYGHISL